MEIKATLIAAAMTLLLGTFAPRTTAAPQDNANKEQPKTVVEKCLACHGDYDKLAEKTAAFKAPNGETAKPHQYVPHEDKKDIPECTECHIPHPVPLTDKSDIVKATVNWCYSGCHHASTFRPCKNCH
jgi:hypothetical protein